MNMKYCPKCGKSKPLECFGFQAKSKDGLYPYCKECKKEDNKAYREENRDAINTHKREAYWNNIEHYRKYYREYQQSHEYREYWSSYIKKHPELVRAHGKVQTALKNGLIKKCPCEVCGAKKTEAHHDNYNEPLNIRWLCKKCHMKWHRDNQAKH